jgi:hypothetical protein
MPSEPEAGFSSTRLGPRRGPTLVMWLIRKIVPKDRSAWALVDVNQPPRCLTEG